ncbi:MAG TPA: hypothetical protein VGB53_04055 [Rubricoccaceae bacterium]|jgi:hypothetical protein
MRATPFALTALALTALALTALAPSAARAQAVYDQILAVPGDTYSDAWSGPVREILTARYDRNRSGTLDTAAEVDGVACEAWEAMQDAVPLGVRDIYGFTDGYGWVGTSLGFAEAQRARAYTAATRCLPGAAVAEKIAAVPDPPSSEWIAATGRLLLQTYDRDRSGTIGRAEAPRIECDVWRAVETGYAQGEYHRFWVGYGFEDGLIWNASDLGFDETAREAAFADMEACPRLFADAEAAREADDAADTGGSSVRVPTDSELMPTFTQRLDSELADSDRTLSSGEYVDTWVLYAAAGQQITVEVTSDEFDPYIILKSPSGEQFDNDDWEGSTRIARIVHDDAEEGQWEVLATSYRAGTTGTYGVTLSTAFPSDGLSSPSTVDDLVGTTWAEDCPGSNPSRSYIRLDADGSFAWSEEDASEMSADDTDGADVWEVENGQLVVRWNDSYAVSRYTLTGEGILPGTTSKACGAGIRLLLMP